MASTSESTEQPNGVPQDEHKDMHLSGKDLESSLKIGTYMFYVALSPLIMQVRTFFEQPNLLSSPVH
jgi:hypothetical protein